jgi:hypothetical protein
MAITAVHKVPAMTWVQYDKVVKELEVKGAGAPDGRLYHVASPDGAGWFVVDVWESEEKLNKFAQVLMPTLEGVGVAPPQPEIRPVHNIIKG